MIKIDIDKNTALVTDIELTHCNTVLVSIVELHAACLPGEDWMGTFRSDWFNIHSANVNRAGLIGSIVEGVDGGLDVADIVLMP